jgi:hypothetical protein
MRPPVWRPPVALSPAEQAVVKRVRRAKLLCGRGFVLWLVGTDPDQGTNLS